MIVLISLFACSLIFLIAYILVINILYSKENKRMLNMKNTFLYEGSSFVVTKGFLFVSLLTTLAASIIYTSHYFSEPYGSLSIFVVVITSILVFCLGALPFVSFRTLKEHLYLDIGALVTLIALFGIETYYCYDIYKLYDYSNNYALAGLIVSAFLLLITLSFVFNPHLFDLKMNIREEGVERKKIIVLALLEWTMPFLSSISIVPLILLSSAF